MPKKTVYENIAYAMEVVGESRRNIKKRVMEVLDLVGLKHKVRSFPNELSGGEQQRIAIARAIVNNPKVLIADEPTGNLDPDNSWEIMNLLERINPSRDNCFDGDPQQPNRKYLAPPCHCHREWSCGS